MRDGAAAKWRRVVAHPRGRAGYPGRQSPVLVLLRVELGNELISRRGKLIFRKREKKLGGVLRVWGVCFRVFLGCFRVLGGVFAPCG